MAMTDTAEYWDDVKRSRYSKNHFYHGIGVDCGHRHNHETKYVDDVECKACKRILATSEKPESMVDGSAPKYYYMTKNAAKAARKADALREQRGKCDCGGHWVERMNKATQKPFLGCQHYPRCKNTKSI